MVRNPQELLHDGENCATNKVQFISASLSVQQERLIEPTPYYFVRVAQPGYKRVKVLVFQDLAQSRIVKRGLSNCLVFVS